jgi:hypothetical protein
MSMRASIVGVATLTTIAAAAPSAFAQRTAPREGRYTCSVSYARGASGDSSMRITMKGVSSSGGEAELTTGGRTATRKFTLSAAAVTPISAIYQYAQDDGVRCTMLASANGQLLFKNCSDGTTRDCEPSAPAAFGPGRDSNACVNDVAAAFRAIPERVDETRYLRAHNNGRITKPDYTQSTSNNLGRLNHFQGIQRLPASAGPYVVITGADEPAKVAHLAIVRMGSRNAEGAWALQRGNRVQRPGSIGPWDTIIPPGDQIETFYVLSRGARNHAGGFQAVGSTLFIPITGGGSEIAIVDVSNPRAPKRVDTIERGPNDLAIAATKLADGNILLGVWSDKKRIEFFKASTATGFKKPFATWDKDAVKCVNGQDCNFSEFQTVNFVNQCDGKLFLVGTHNTSTAAPVIGGRDYADLYRVDFDSEYARAPQITKVANKHMYCHDRQCNFDAAAGVYVQDANHMWIYAAYHFLHDDQIRFNEYAY